MENGFPDKSICFFPLSIFTKENRSEKHAGCLCGHGYWFACSVLDADWRNLLESSREVEKHSIEEEKTRGNISFVAIVVREI